MQSSSSFPFFFSFLAVSCLSLFVIPYFPFSSFLIFFSHLSFSQPHLQYGEADEHGEKRRHDRVAPARLDVRGGTLRAQPDVIVLVRCQPPVRRARTYTIKGENRSRQQ